MRNKTKKYLTSLPTDVKPVGENDITNLESYRRSCFLLLSIDLQRVKVTEERRDGGDFSNEGL